MTIKKALNAPYARIILAAILGFGLSTLFRKSCSDKKCIDFKAPAFKTVEDGIWRVDDKCYAFKSSPAACDNDKRTVHFA